MKLRFIQLIVFISLFCCKTDEGPEGPEGLNSLVEFVDEVPGLNCKNGGLKIVAGIDQNHNNVLDQNEITSGKFICNGDDGVLSLFTTVVEPAGINCVDGGIKALFGKDLNKNEQLDANEVEQTRFLCNGNDGIPSLLTTIVEPAGINCPNGGIKSQFGRDLNKNDQLDADEIEQTRFLCNGGLGIPNLMITVSEPSGNNCVHGGFKTQLGKDLNQNGQLDLDEIEQTRFVCNGKTGEGAREVRFFLGSACGYNGPIFGDPETTVPVIRRTELIEFTIGNYSEYDSIVYIVDGVNVTSLSGPSTGNAIIELADLETGITIPNSQIISGNTSRAISKNIWQNFPANTLDVGIKISSETNDIFSCASNLQLILVKK